MRKSLLLLTLLMVVFVTCTEAGFAKKDLIRVGYFPNITHSQALVGLSDGTFQRVLGKNVEIKSYIFNAGPSVIEAMMSSQLDLAYIGPNPAINGYLRTKGTLLRIIAGAASGGAGLVVRKNLNIKRVQQLDGCTIASPQIGNTQDVALRFFLKNNGLKPLEKGGKVQILPISNPDQLTLFLKKEIAAAWTVEPWVSRLIEEAGGDLFMDERSIWENGKFVTANVIARQSFLKKNPQVVKQWLRAHVELTVRINEQLVNSQKIVNQEIKKITGKPLPESIISQAFKRFEVTYDPLAATLYESAEHAYSLGFLGKKKPNLTGIYDLKLLNQVLKDLKLPTI